MFELLLLHLPHYLKFTLDHQCRFSISGLSNSSYTVGNYLIGNCIDKSYLSGSVNPYIISYTDYELINICGFSYINNSIIGTVDISADLCGIYNSTCVACDIIGGIVANSIPVINGK